MITYKKPKELTYVDMCIWLDSAVTESKFSDEEKAFKYLYWLYTMFALKYNWFNNEDDIDQYAIYAAEMAFMRMVNKELDPISKSLQYIKTTAYPYKVQYQQQYYYQGLPRKLNAECLSYEEIAENTDYDDTLELRNAIRRTTIELSRAEVEKYLEDVSRTIKDFVFSTATYDTAEELNNIYISCLLTYIQQVKFCDSSRISLFHLDKTYNDVILLMVREIKKLISNDIRYLSREEIPNLSTDTIWFMSTDCNDTGYDSDDYVE